MVTDPTRSLAKATIAKAMLDEAWRQAERLWRRVGQDEPVSKATRKGWDILHEIDDLEIGHLVDCLREAVRGLDAALEAERARLLVVERAKDGRVQGMPS